MDAVVAWGGGVLGLLGSALALWTYFNKSKIELAAKLAAQKTLAAKEQLEVEAVAAKNKAAEAAQKALDAKEQAEVEAATAKNKMADLDYLFAQYRETVDRVRKEHEEDRAILAALQAEHTHCREELAGMKERLTLTDAELVKVRRELAQVQKRGQP